MCKFIDDRIGPQISDFRKFIIKLLGIMGIGNECIEKISSSLLSEFDHVITRVHAQVSIEKYLLVSFLISRAYRFI